MSPSSLIQARDCLADLSKRTYLGTTIMMMKMKMGGSVNMTEIHIRECSGNVSEYDGNVKELMGISGNVMGISGNMTRISGTVTGTSGNIYENIRMSFKKETHCWFWSSLFFLFVQYSSTRFSWVSSFSKMTETENIIFTNLSGSLLLFNFNTVFMIIVQLQEVEED